MYIMCTFGYDCIIIFPESENEASIVSNDSNENEENTPVASSVPNCNPDKLGIHVGNYVAVSC